jgi:hypothetical protein
MSLDFKLQKFCLSFISRCFFCENVFGIHEHFVACSLQMKFHYAHWIVTKFRFFLLGFFFMKTLW